MNEGVSGTSATTPVTKAIRQTLRAEIKRTGVTALMLLKNAQDAPDGLNAAHVNRWIGGIVRSAPASHVRYVTARWEALPDDAGRVSRDGEVLPKRGMRFADPSAMGGSWGSSVCMEPRPFRRVRDHSQRTTADAVANSINDIGGLWSMYDRHAEMEPVFPLI